MHTNLNPTTEEVASFIENLRYPRLAAYVVSHLMANYEATREEAVRMWENYRAKQVVDERTTFRGLTEHERDVLRYALSHFAKGDKGPLDLRRDAQSMLDQDMVSNFLWKSSGA